MRVAHVDGVRTAGFSGVVTCGSVWACPQCSAKIAAGRQTDIEAGITEWTARGGAVALATFTIRHNNGHRLRTLMDVVSSCWTATCGGRGWQTDQASYGTPFDRVVKTGKRAGQTVVDLRIPTIRVWEVTHGDDSGWHVHVHALLFLRGDITQDECDQLGARMFARWDAAVEDESMRPTRTHGVDVKLLHGDASAALGDYFTKQTYPETDPAKSASYEVARGDLKDARWGNRTPFAILRGLVLARSGEVDPTALDVAGDEGLWAEWETATKGRRQVYWTPGLRAHLFPDLTDEEATDQELADAALDGDTVAEIPGLVFRQVTRHRADWQLLSAFGRSDREGWAFLAPFFALAEAEETARDARHQLRYRT